MSGGEKIKLKKILPFIATVAITLLVAFVTIAFLLRPKTLEIGSVDLNTVDDGEYIPHQLYCFKGNRKRLEIGD